MKPTSLSAPSHGLFKRIMSDALSLIRPTGSGGLLLITALLGSPIGNAQTAPKTLTDLLKQVQSDSASQSQELARREAEFRKERNRQAELFKQVQQELARERARGESLKKRYQDNESFLTEQTGLKREKTGSLGELFGVVKQTAKELNSLLLASLTTAQYPERDEALKKLVESKTQPTITELESLWQMLLQEMVASSQITRFTAPVIGLDGQQNQTNVVRLGPFNALTEDGLYLRYQPETERLMVLARQPAMRYRQKARSFIEADAGIAELAIDPSRGAILSMLVESPDWRERIAQGGIIGYLILALGLIGLILAVERFFVLGKLKRKMTETNGSETPLTRLRQAANDHPKLDAEALALKLEQVILSERPAIRRFLSTLAVFAAIAPLLGLLGTVAGMIETFQAITLFGTSDPKLMSGGISAALVTTELGLIVAIPLVLLHNHLAGKSRQLMFLFDQENIALLADREAQRHAGQG